MKFVITENQFKSLVMEVDEKDLQKVSNYVTRAVRTKYPVVDEIDIVPFKNYDGHQSLRVHIFVDSQLQSRDRRSDSVTEWVILNYVIKIIEKFFGLDVIRVSFDSTKFKYEGGNWNT